MNKAVKFKGLSWVLGKNFPEVEFILLSEKL